MFVLSDFAEDIYEQLKKHLENGHKLALHGKEHIAPRKHSNEKFRAQIISAKTKLENGFDLSDYDLRCLDYAKAYATRLLAIDVNLKIDEMLDTAWELFGTYFTKAETGIKQEFIDQYWKGN